MNRTILKHKQDEGRELYQECLRCIKTATDTDILTLINYIKAINKANTVLKQTKGLTRRIHR